MPILDAYFLACSWLTECGVAEIGPNLRLNSCPGEAAAQGKMSTPRTSIPTTIFFGHYPLSTTIFFPANGHTDILCPMKNWPFFWKTGVIAEGLNKMHYTV